MSCWLNPSAPRSRRREDTANDFLRQRPRGGRQSLLRLSSIILDILLCGLHLRLSFAACLVQGVGSSLQHGLAPCLLRAEYRSPRLAQESLPRDPSLRRRL